MIKLASSSEAEMVALFLMTEITSVRYAAAIRDVLDRLNLSDELILNADVSNDSENRQRKDILGDYRGYGRNRGLFERFPTDVQWTWTRFGQEDLDRVRYINYSYWNELSGGTGSPLEAARTIRSGVTIFNVSNDGFWQAYHWLQNGTSLSSETAFRNGHAFFNCSDNPDCSGQAFLPMIMLTDIDAARFTVLEGHLRMTAYGLAPDRFRDVVVLLGTCKKDELCQWFGASPIIGL